MEGRARDPDAMTGSSGPAWDPGPGLSWPALAVAPAPFRAHGMGGDLVEPDWPPHTDAEVSAVLARYGRTAGPATVRWRSPRPMSAAALADSGGDQVFVKRHHVLVRTAAQLGAEHALAGHLRALGVAVPVVLRLPDGGSTVRSGGYLYEVHARAAGIDLYRDVLSWEPFTSAEHAWAAGAALARFHQATASFGRPARPPAVLTSSCAVIAAADPLAAVARLAARRPGLASYLDGQPWQDDFISCHLPAIGRLAPLLPRLGRLWGHGDWHPSNLTWTSDRPDAGVAAVIDLGLANRTFAAHDLAVAIERSAVSWLDLAESGPAHPDIPAAAALLDGYESVRPLSQAELGALPLLLPVVHVEYALSEVEYFSSVVRSRENADLAYHTYLVGHTRWFGTAEGRALLSHLRQRADRQPAAP
jgi:Ser/Thr protein kinase RdoA (MazF antagonist)